MREVQKQDGGKQLPRIESVARATNRAKESIRPKNPAHLFFILELEKLSLPGPFFISDLYIGNRNAIGSSKAGKYLVHGRNFWDYWRPIYPLYSIDAFVKKLGEIKQVPLLNICMSKRRGADYSAIFYFLIDWLGGLDSIKAECLVMDYEKTVLRAVLDNFRKSKIRGCAFHWSQAIYRKILKLGLENNYKDRNSDISEILWLVFHLHLVPRRQHRILLQKDRRNGI